jgi:prepilin-type N-terminal cleavage/methylation domain-containing protein
MKPLPCSRPNNHLGFSLVEMAIVLLIVGLLVGGLLPGLGSQMEKNRASDTQSTLNTVTEALFGYAAGHGGSLPCPATVASAGFADPATAGTTNGICTSPFAGFVPGRLLGLTPLNADGFVIDAWGNPIRYSVATMNIGGGSTNRAITVENGVRNMGIASFGTFATYAPATNTLLLVCASATGITATTCGPATNLISNDAVAVLYSYGPSGIIGSGTDEGENNDGDQFYVSHPKTDTFDHIVQWIPRNTFVSKMLSAGALP